MKHIEQRSRSKSQVKRCFFLAIRVCLKSYFAAVLNELQVPFSGLNQLTNTRNYTVKE